MSDEEQLDKILNVRNGKLVDRESARQQILSWHQQELERAVAEARLDELMSIELVCEDSEARTEWLLNTAISINTSGKSLKDRIIELEEDLKK